MDWNKAQVGDRIKRSDYALRSKRDYWLSQGEYARRNRAKEAYDAALAERGTIAELLVADSSRGTANGLRVTWDNGQESRCLPGMVEIATD